MQTKLVSPLGSPYFDGDFLPLPVADDSDFDRPPTESEVEDNNEEDEIFFTPNRGADYEAYLWRLLDDSPFTLDDHQETPENSVVISFSDNDTSVRRSLFRQ